jgi:glutamine phosphoribosylpyrophosphate amidotransferase
MRGGPKEPRIIAAVCEQFIARAADPFRLDELWPFTDRLERFGMAGFGWGAAWLTPDGAIESYRNVAAFRDDAGRDAVGAQQTTSVLVHVRRPSKLSTRQLADTQPFVDPGGRYAFSHNGDLSDVALARQRFQSEGRIAGRADTEVGARWLEDAWDDCGSPAAALRALHDRFGGEANLATLSQDGSVVHYAGNTENPVYAFRLGRIGVASTALYSIDRSLFQLAAPGAADRRVVRPGVVIALAPDGLPIPG